MTIINESYLDGVTMEKIIEFMKSSRCVSPVIRQTDQTRLANVWTAMVIYSLFKGL